jgi:hypothetical protein
MAVPDEACHKHFRNYRPGSKKAQNRLRVSFENCILTKLQYSNNCTSNMHFNITVPPHLVKWKSPAFVTGWFRSQENSAISDRRPSEWVATPQNEMGHMKERFATVGFSSFEHAVRKSKKYAASTPKTEAGASETLMTIYKTTNAVRWKPQISCNASPFQTSMLMMFWETTIT